jgi:DNA polymerase-4
METGWSRGSQPVRLLGLGVRLGESENVDQLRLFEDSAKDSDSPSGSLIVPPGSV